MRPPGGAVTIVEVCPRDGLQNERAVLEPTVRAELVLRTAAAGATRIEAVSFVDPARVPQMAEPERVLELVRAQAPDLRLGGLVLNARGLDRALSAAVDEVNVVVPCTDAMSLRNQGRDAAEMIAAGRTMVGEARCSGAFVTLTVAVAFGCPFEGEVAVDAVRRVVAGVAAAGVDEVALADTVGVGVPAQVRALTAAAREEAPSLPLRFHFHNTRNTGYANASAAVDAGVTVLDASLGGFGGCPFAPAATGNIATEDLAYLLHRSGYRTGLDPELLSTGARWLGTLLGQEPPALLGRAGTFPGPSAAA